MDPQLVRLSKFLSFVLRHDPGTIGITLDPNGWVPVDELLSAAARGSSSERKAPEAPTMGHLRR
jgi:putative RNA 2'-phosphotransferase